MRSADAASILPGSSCISSYLLMLFSNKQKAEAEEDLWESEPSVGARVVQSVPFMAHILFWLLRLLIHGGSRAGVAVWVQSGACDDWHLLSGSVSSAGWWRWFLSFLQTLVYFSLMYSSGDEVHQIYDVFLKIKSKAGSVVSRLRLCLGLKSLPKHHQHHVRSAAPPLLLSQ